MGVQLLLSIALSGLSYSLLWGDRRRGGDPGGCAAVDSTIGLELLTFVGRQAEERGPWWVCSCR